MLDSEGASLTPYQVTIKNNCGEYGAYQVNLEVLNTTTLDSAFVKIMFDEQDPKLLNSYTAVEKTLTNATSAYKMTTGYLNPNEERTYTLRLWLDENVTLEDHVEGKKFASKITIANTYKANAPTSQEECEVTYGEGASICNIIAQADPTNSKCLQVNEDGSIKNPDSTMSDSETPIICTMEDDYGTSYYLRGNHQDNNVKFANMCWKLVRVTGTGGYKLIYNGDLDENGKCTTTSGEHMGFEGQRFFLSGNKVYGTSYTKEGSTYTLTNTSNIDFSTDSASTIGKYTCGDTSTVCANPYYVVSKEDVAVAYVRKMGVSTNYAQIGTSAFNSSTNSPSYVGYMYNDVYASQSKTMTNSGLTILSSQSSSSSNFYYGDTISYSGGQYYITNQDGSNVTQLSWADDYTSLPGKYTCRSTSKYNDTTIRCTTAYKVLDTTTNANYMIAEYLRGGRTSVGTIKLSNGYTDNGDGTYTLNSPVTEKSAMEWYNGYSSFNNYYVCEDYNQTTCNKLYKITSASQTSIGKEIGVFNNYYYGESFTYNNGTYTLNNTVQFWDISNSTNQTKLNTHHYTCFNASNNICQELYYIYYLNGTTLYYIKLNGNETGLEALNKMVNNNDINVKDSHIKGTIDWWYEQNIKNTEYESKLEDTVFCNDRTINQLNGWSENGSINKGSNSYLKFNAYNNKYYLKCPNKRDAFTVSDTEKGNSALTYPVGLLTTAEHSLIGNYTVNKTNVWYWPSAPRYFSEDNAVERSVYHTGTWDYNVSVTYSGGVRPALSLRPGTNFKAGTDGTASNPYEVE
ncbi:MAG: hypothetical protein IJ743_03320 [Bacilli bacterium]|nr:hypothetical protein [Bacilli bacterium]